MCGCVQELEEVADGGLINSFDRMVGHCHRYNAKVYNKYDSFEQYQQRLPADIQAVSQVLGEPLMPFQHVQLTVPGPVRDYLFRVAGVQQSYAGSPAAPWDQTAAVGVAAAAEAETADALVAAADAIAADPEHGNWKLISPPRQRPAAQASGSGSAARGNPQQQAESSSPSRARLTTNLSSAFEEAGEPGSMSVPQPSPVHPPAAAAAQQAHSAAAAAAACPEQQLPLAADPGVAAELQHWVAKVLLACPHNTTTVHQLQVLYNIEYPPACIPSNISNSNFVKYYMGSLGVSYDGRNLDFTVARQQQQQQQQQQGSH
jgi:hypothetical protein